MDYLMKLKKNSLRGWNYCLGSVYNIIFHKKNYHCNNANEIKKSYNSNKSLSIFCKNSVFQPINNVIININMVLYIIFVQKYIFVEFKIKLKWIIIMTFKNTF